MYVIGGTTESNQTVARVDTFDSETQTWSTTTPLPEAVSSPAVIVVGGAVFVAGGLANSGQLVNSLYELDTTTQRWRTLPPMQTPRSNAAIAVLDGALYVIGGAGASGVLNSVERYDIASNHWTSATPLPVPLLNLGAATVGNVIHVFREDAHYAYSPLNDQWIALSSMHFPRHAFGTAVVADRIFLIGGCDTGLSDSAVTEVLELNRASS